jgi:hypothetical protein
LRHNRQPGGGGSGGGGGVCGRGSFYRLLYLPNLDLRWFVVELGLVVAIKGVLSYILPQNASVMENHQIENKSLSFLETPSNKHIWCMLGRLK